MAALHSAAAQVRNVDTVEDFKDIKGIGDIKEMSVKVLRGLFSGVGQLLLAADRFRAGEAQHAAIDQDKRSGPPTGLDGDRQAEHQETVDYVSGAAGSGRKQRPAGARGRSTGGSRQTRKAGPARAARPAAGRRATAAPELPVPGYDERSLASLRSRLRFLDVSQLRILLEHERSASNRADVVTMFERRIAKIESRSDAT